MNNKKTIIYIMSDNRSGSTLLENILSNSPDIVSVGELHHLDSYLNKGRWGRGVNWECTCGSQFSDCTFWFKIIENLKKKRLNKIEQTAVSKNRSFKYASRMKPVELPENKEIIETVDAVYESIFEVSGKNFIVDSSKDEVQLAALLKYSRFKIKVIFQKRDIRAVVLSKLKWQQKFENKQVNIFKQLLATKIKYDIQKNVFNKLVKKGDGLKLNYKDLANDVPATLTKIIDFAGINHFPTPIYMEMHKNHSVGGTPNREKRLIRYDDSWEKKAAKRPVFRFLGKIIDNL